MVETEDTLISFTVAKQAKDAGFNWPCNNWYSKSGELYKDQNGFSDNTSSQRTSAPTQQVLQIWLREEKGLDVFVNYAYDTFNYAAELHEIGDKKDLIDGFTIYDEYEKAFEEGLDTGLSYILGHYGKSN